ncbi:MAG: S8 family peptidase [Cyclobacteriaceae bacterium]|nr:S8 family peptidase [Cyclobacteriaceae bacterium]
MGWFSNSLLLVLWVCSSAWAQTHRYMVFFTDKAGTPHTITQPSTFLSDRAIQRRAKSMIAVNSDDLPVVPSYVSQVRATGAKAFFTTRWMNGVLIEATAAQLTAIQSLPFVSSTEYVAPNHRLLGGRSGDTRNMARTSLASDTQLRMLTIDSMHADGLQGEGILIAVLDSGFPGVESTAAFQEMRDGGRILMTQDFITNSSNIYQFDDHGTEVLSIIGARDGNFSGGAPASSFLLFVTEDVPTEYRIEEYNWLFAAERADSAGADIIQSSVGYSTFDDPAMNYATSDLNGTTAVVSKAAGWARDRGIIVVVSAGNEGGGSWQLITPPADVDGILSVGAVTSWGAKVSFSSTGPTVDGRIKPDVMAMGSGVSVINPFGAVVTVDGTSAAAPLVSSLVAGLLQRFPDMKPSALVQSIKASASQGDQPDNQIGYGIPGYLSVKNYLERQNWISAYPNPVTSTLWLTVTPQLQPQRITIFDSMGKVVMNYELPEITWSNSKIHVDVSALSSGIYILRVDLPSAMTTFRFVKH